MFKYFLNLIRYYDIAAAYGDLVRMEMSSKGVKTVVPFAQR